MRKGFHGTSVREIGEEAGLSQSSLYYHAKSKAQILFDLNKEFMSQLQTSMEDIGAQDISPPEKVRLVIGELLNVVAAHQAQVTIVLRERRSLPAKHARAVQRQRDRIDDVIDSILRQGISEGFFRPVDIPLTRLGLTGMANWAYEWYQAGGRFTPEAIASHFADIFLVGLSRQP
jgi:AcrR family transcriptional regulator